MKRFVEYSGLVLLFVLLFSGQRPNTPYPFPELKFFPKMPVTRENPVTVEGAGLGRYLFYDPILSADQNMSCASCHKQKYAFSDYSKAFSKGRNGTLMKRNTMPLFNLAWYPSLFWDGRAASIEDQVFHPIQSSVEMNLTWSEAVARLNNSPFYKNLFQRVFQTNRIDSNHVRKAIAQFLRTLISHNSKYDRVIGGEGRFTPEEAAGFELMNDQTKGDCLHCHTTDADPLGTTLSFSNNGLDEVIHPGEYKDKGRGETTGRERDNGNFKIPSIRNLLLTAPYMHDGRFSTLGEVLNFYSEGVHRSANLDSKMEYAYQGGVRLTPVEKKNIIAFLTAFTDSNFISSPEFSNPFNH